MQLILLCLRYVRANSRKCCARDTFERTHVHVTHFHEHDTAALTTRVLTPVNRTNNNIITGQHTVKARCQCSIIILFI